MGDFDITAKAGTYVRCEMVLRDGVGRPIALKDVLSLLATLYEPDQGAIVNGRFRQDVLNVNGGSLHGDGRFALWLTPADNQTVIGDASEESHVLLLEVTLTDGRIRRQHHRILVTESLAPALVQYHA